MRPSLRVLCSLAAFLLPGAAPAVTLTKVSESTPWTGVTIRKYRTSSPSANLHVALVDLCRPSVHVDATRSPSGPQGTGAWAQSVGAQLATNGDFYKPSPNRIYGQAVGDGIAWPSIQTGYDPRYASEWYYEKAGWIAFLHDRVEYSHTEHVKKNPGGRTLGGFSPTQVTGAVPPGTLALVSGFSELVVEGTRVTCASPTASTCFPDRGDMRARHPRTAMGLSRDLHQFILAVVDGRTSTSSGMYGTELAETMQKLGAYVAFNLDGGGSSQMWQQGRGYLNDYDGNNMGNGVRPILNHWGVFAGAGNGRPVRAGHCDTTPPCQVIPATGGTVDDTSSCFRAFGPPASWRRETGGQGGSLRWTNAGGTALPVNWAWWQLHLAAAGSYRVEYWAEPAYAKFARTRYEVYANGRVSRLTVDQSKGRGWTSLGTFTFAAGGGQYVRLDDNQPTGTVPSGQRIVADAIRLVPAGPSCGDGTCNGAETCAACAADCGPCPTCGDGACNGAETCAACAADCGPCCGNGACAEGEACDTCAADCGPCPTCGDGACNGTEACGTCIADCGACCGDGTCDEGETCEACPGDCGPCPVCGDGQCGGREGCASCEADCGACAVCGNGACEGGETCDTCADDCACPRCGDGQCSDSETCSTCTPDCGPCPDEAPCDPTLSDCPDDAPAAPEDGCRCGRFDAPWSALLPLLLSRRRRR